MRRGEYEKDKKWGRGGEEKRTKIRRGEKSEEKEDEKTRR